MKNYAIILAAGRGSRMNKGVNKVFLPLNDKPIIAHTLDVFYRAKSVYGIVLVVAPGEAAYIKDKLFGLYPPKKPLTIVSGGDQRQFSVYEGLKVLPPDTDTVIIHDGARPLVSLDVLEKSIEVSQKQGAAVAGMPVKDTIKETGDGGKVERTLNRDRLWQVQTPQTFKYSLIMKAHEKALSHNYLATDDSALVENMGQEVYMIKGGYHNIKITTPEDILIAQRILEEGEEGLL